MKSRGLLGARDAALIPPEILHEYAATDADAAFRVWKVLKRRLKEQGMKEYFHTASRPLCSNLLRSGLMGMRVDKTRMFEIADRLETVTRRIQSKIEEIAGERINLNAPAQKARVIFDVVGIPTDDPKVPLTTTGQYTTDRKILEKLFEKYQHPILRHCINWARASKLQSNYAPGLEKWIDKTHRVHTLFQVGAQVSGRVSSKEPPLATMPRDKDHNDYPFLELKDDEVFSLRDMFIAAPGCELTSADVKQAELVAIAVIAGDEKMLLIFRERRDFHNEVAWTVFKVPRNEKPNKTIRTLSKGIVFGGFLYGGSAEGIAAFTGAPVDLIAGAMEGFAGQFPLTCGFLDGIAELAIQEKVITSPFGRKRRFVVTDYHDEAQLNHLRRQARDFFPQNAAAELTFRSMNRICARFEKYRMKAWPVNLVYDNIIVEHPRAERRAVREIMSEEMTRPVPQLDNYRFAMEIGTADRWGEAERSAQVVYPEDVKEAA